MRIIENMILCKWLSVKCRLLSYPWVLSGPDSVANVLRDAQATEVITDVAA
jgi:hypothetical protein